MNIQKLPTIGIDVKDLDHYPVVWLIDTASSRQNHILTSD